MTSTTITGRNALGEAVTLSKDVSYFADAKDYFRVELEESSIKITTPKGSYQLSKHPTLNIYNGTCNGRKVHVSLKKVIGEIRFW